MPAGFGNSEARHWVEQISESGPRLLIPVLPQTSRVTPCKASGHSGRPCKKKIRVGLRWFSAHRLSKIMTSKIKKSHTSQSAAVPYQHICNDYKALAAHLDATLCHQRRGPASESVSERTGGGIRGRSPAVSKVWVHTHPPATTECAPGPQAPVC